MEYSTPPDAKLSQEGSQAGSQWQFSQPHKQVSSRLTSRLSVIVDSTGIAAKTAGSEDLVGPSPATSHIYCHGPTHICMNQLLITIDCTSHWGPQKASNVWRVGVCVCDEVYSRFVLLPMLSTIVLFYHTTLFVTNITYVQLRPLQPDHHFEDHTMMAFNGNANLTQL